MVQALRQCLGTLRSALSDEQSRRPGWSLSKVSSGHVMCFLFPMRALRSCTLAANVHADGIAQLFVALVIRYEVGLDDRPSPSAVFRPGAHRV